MLYYLDRIGTLMATRWHHKCRNPSLGLTTKVRGYKGAGQEEDPGVTSHALRSAKSVRESAFTFPSELPWWELKS
jgi:hypothetical protein